MLGKDSEVEGMKGTKGSADWIVNICLKLIRLRQFPD